MTNGYDVAKQAFLGTGTRIDLDADTIKVRLVNISADYTFDATHTTMSSVTKYTGTTDQTLASATIVTTSPVVAFDAADPTFSGVAVDGTKTVAAFVVFKFVTDDAGSTPILYVPVTAVLPNGGDLTVQFDATSTRIFSLSG